MQIFPQSYIFLRRENRFPVLFEGYECVSTLSRRNKLRDGQAVANDKQKLRNRYRMAVLFTSFVVESRDVSSTAVCHLDIYSRCRIENSHGSSRRQTADDLLDERALSLGTVVADVTTRDALKVVQGRNSAASRRRRFATRWSFGSIVCTIRAITHSDTRALTQATRVRNHK